VAQGAATGVWCATSPQLDGMGGVYCENVDIAPVRHEDGGVLPMQAGVRLTGTLGVMPYAIDLETAERLWKLSERLL